MVIKPRQNPPKQVAPISADCKYLCCSFPWHCLVYLHSPPIRPPVATRARSSSTNYRVLLQRSCFLTIWILDLLKYLPNIWLCLWLAELKNNNDGLYFYWMFLSFDNCLHNCYVILPRNLWERQNILMLQRGKKLQPEHSRCLIAYQSTGTIEAGLSASQRHWKTWGGF